MDYLLQNSLQFPELWCLNRSCFCTSPTLCICYDLSKANFNESGKMGVHREKETKLKEPTEAGNIKSNVNRRLKVTLSKTDLYKNSSVDSTETSGTFTRNCSTSTKRKTSTINAKLPRKAKLQKLAMLSTVTNDTGAKRFFRQRVGKILSRLVNNFQNCGW